MHPRSIALALGSACAGGVLVFVAMRRPEPAQPPTPPAPREASGPAPAAPRVSPFADRAGSRDDEPGAEPSASPIPPVAVPDRGREAAIQEKLARAGDAPAVVVSHPPTSPTIEEAVAKASQAAVAAVEKLRPELRRECWDALADPPDRAMLALVMSYDAEGRVIASAIEQQERASYRAELGTCLAPYAAGLHIDPPGEPVSLSVPVAFP